jgi:hypothetical protein
VKRLMLILAACATLAPSLVANTKVQDVFYVYEDKGSKLNHFIPSGWMGDYGDLKIDDANKDNPATGKTSIKWTYDAQARQGANWTGVYWQQPANNWGDKPGGFELKGYRRLTFMARGDKGGETINEFKVGGITGEHSDTDARSIGPVTLTKDWKKYTIDLADADLTKIIGGFCWATSKDNNQDGFVIYLDEIKFER